LGEHSGKASSASCRLTKKCSQARLSGIVVSQCGCHEPNGGNRRCRYLRYGRRARPQGLRHPYRLHSSTRPDRPPYAVVVSLRSAMGHTRRVDPEVRKAALISLLLAQLRSADRVRKSLLLGVVRTCGRHHETGANDPVRTSGPKILRLALDPRGHPVATRHHAQLFRAPWRVDRLSGAGGANFLHSLG